MKQYTLAQKIASLLQEAGLTQADLAKMLDLERASINTWIQGRHIPTNKNIEKLSIIFGIGVDWFLDEEARFPAAKKYRLPGMFSDRTVKHDAGTLSVEGDALPIGSRNNEADPSHRNPIEIISDNLFRVNSPKLRILFHKLEVALKMKDAERVSRLCNNMNMLLRREVGEMTIRIHPTQAKERIHEV
jgi:plasmid maintenance system antidote protein VapI